MSRPMVSTDADLCPSGELELPTTRPFGHRVMHLVTDPKPYCIVSESRGILGYCAEPEMAQPFLRMLFVDAQRGIGRLDYRLWRWNGSAWEVYQRTLPLHETGRIAA